jgi:hypothetical protein
MVVPSGGMSVTRSSDQTTEGDLITELLLLRIHQHFRWLAQRFSISTRQARGQWFNPTTPHQLGHLA